MRCVTVAVVIVATTTFAAAFSSAPGSCSECLANSKIGGNTGTFCSLDNTTHINIKSGALSTCQRVSRTCGVLYAGPCGCPNNCTAGVQGQCQPSSSSQFGQQCVCNEGWGGADCNTPLCPTNACSGHGVCNGVGAPPHACMCDAGWSGATCDTPDEPYGDVPWGCASPPLYPHPPDNKGGATDGCWRKPRPWADFKGLPQLRVAITPADWRNMSIPTADLHYDPKFAVNTTFLDDRSGARVTYTGAHMRIRGNWGRWRGKKSYKFYFNKGATSDPADADWPKHLSIKPSSYIDGAQFFATMLMTAGSPAWRRSFGLLFVNDVYMGVYAFFGDWTNGYTEYWYGGKTAADEGAYYKVTGPAMSGSAPSSSEPPMTGGAAEDYAAVYRLATDASVTQAEFDAGVVKHMDTDAFARCIVVVTLGGLGDTFLQSRGGNNYQWFWSPTTRLSISIRDFDHFLGHLYPIEKFFTYTPLVKRLRQSLPFMTLFVQRYEALLDTINFDNATRTDVVNTTAWFESFGSHLGPWLSRDQMELLAPFGNVPDFPAKVKSHSAAVKARADAMRSEVAQIKASLSALRHTSPQHGHHH